jgi:ABC-type Fe3+-hydroxamate transport system substrate-binding protein
VLSPALAATLKDLGVEGRIVGRHAWDMVLDPAVPVVGNELGEVDYERLRGLSPTLVVGQFGAAGPPARLRELATSRGWVLRDYNPLSLADVSRTAEALARDAEAAGCEGVGAALGRVMGELRASLTAVPGRSRAGRVLLLAEVSPPAALGPGSFHHEVLVALGGVPAITEGTPFITMDAEDVRRAAPDAVLIIAPRGRGGAASGPGQARSALGPLGSLDVPAFRSGRVALVDDPVSQLPATTVRTTAAAMAAALDGWSAR